MKMKAYLKSYISLFFIFTLFLLTGCKGKTLEEPSIKILADNQEMQVIYYGDKYNKTAEEIETRLKSYMEGKDLEDLPYIKLNEEIIIETENFQIKEFEVFDYILTELGEFRYDERTVQTSVAPVNDGKATINLSTNFASGLSSNSDDYLPGKTIRCFVINADIEGSPFTFAFILRTDAN